MVLFVLYRDQVGTICGKRNEWVILGFTIFQLHDLLEPQLARGFHSPVGLEEANEICWVSGVSSVSLLFLGRNRGWDSS